MTQPFRPRDYLHDAWAPLSTLIGDGFNVTPLEGVVATWPREDDRRRLLAYRALSAMRDNLRRYWLPASQWVAQPRILRDGSLADVGTPPAMEYREYGHAAALVQAARALVLGDDQVIAVPAAADATDPEAGEDAAASEGRFAASVLTWLQAWAARERLQAKLLEGEEHAIGDGDAVYVLSWSAAANRPRLRVVDPGFYFPDFDAADRPEYRSWGWDDDQFPPVVHLAWEYEDADRVTWLRRTTWRLVPAGDVTVTAGVAALPLRDRPWGRSPWRCLHSVTEWRTDRLKPSFSLYTGTSGDPGGRVVEVERELDVDFIPVVHVPNDEPGERRWGRSLLTLLVQALDDLNGSDTDLATNAQLVASPATVTTGTAGMDLEGGPGAHWELPDGGSAGLVDTSKALDALLKYGDRMLEHVAINSRLAQALLGRIKPNEVPSGYALQLGFAPARSLLRELRLVRDDKYALLLRMAVRMAQAGRALGAGATPDLQLLLGASLPADRPVAIDEVIKLLKERAISRATAVRILMAAGLPIEDAEAELAAIRSTDFAGAGALVDATGNVGDAYEYLDLEPADDPTDPAPPADPATPPAA